MYGGDTKGFCIHMKNDSQCQLTGVLQVAGLGGGNSALNCAHGSQRVPETCLLLPHVLQQVGDIAMYDMAAGELMHGGKSGSGISGRS